MVSLICFLDIFVFLMIAYLYFNDKFQTGLLLCLFFWFDVSIFRKQQLFCDNAIKVVNLDWASWCIKWLRDY